MYPVLQGILPQKYNAHLNSSELNQYFYWIRIYSFSDHFAKLVDAMHILSSTSITLIQLKRAKQLLQSYVTEFEQLYGEENMVFNVHQITHAADCVDNNGPLYLYSTYSMEDHIGHLVSLVKGTTDVCHQVCEKYLLEKHMLLHLEKSHIAKKFYDDIQSQLKFPIAKKIGSDTVIGKPKQILNEYDLILIKQVLRLSDDEQIDEHDSILWNDEIYYESANKIKNKRTCDAFIVNLENNKYAEIKSVFVVGNQTYFFIDEKYKVVPNPAIENIIFLDLLESFDSKVIASTSVGPKHAFAHFDNVYWCTKCPNLYERN